MQIILVRHGQSHVNLADLTAEHPDSPLTEVGRGQAAAVAQWLSTNVAVTQLIGSTVQRARQTTEAIAAAVGIEPIWDNRIREVGTVHPDGSPIEESRLEPYKPEMWGTLRPYERVTETGESWMQVRARVGAFVESLVPIRTRTGWPDTDEVLVSNNPDDPISGGVEADRVVVVVCHAGVIEALLEYVFEKGPRSVVAIHTNHTGLTHLAYQPRANRPDWSLYSHNRVVHLEPEQLTW